MLKPSHLNTSEGLSLPTNQLKRLSFSSERAPKERGGRGGSGADSAVTHRTNRDFCSHPCPPGSGGPSARLREGHAGGAPPATPGGTGAPLEACRGKPFPAASSPLRPAARAAPRVLPRGGGGGGHVEAEPERAQPEGAQPEGAGPARPAAAAPRGAAAPPARRTALTCGAARLLPGGLLKKEVRAVKKNSSDSSSSRLLYPLLMLLVQVIGGGGGCWWCWGRAAESAVPAAAWGPAAAAPRPARGVRGGGGGAAAPAGPLPPSLRSLPAARVLGQRRPRPPGQQVRAAGGSFPGPRPAECWLLHRLGPPPPHLHAHYSSEAAEGGPCWSEKFPNLSLIITQFHSSMHCKSSHLKKWLMAKYWGELFPYSSSSDPWNPAEQSQPPAPQPPRCPAGAAPRTIISTRTIKSMEFIAPGCSEEGGLWRLTRD